MSILSLFARTLEPLRVWFKLPFVLALASVVGNRSNLRAHNLIDTESDPPEAPEPVGDFIGARTPNGSHNDLSRPWMGMSGTRFGRNVRLNAAFGETGDRLMDPSPRLVSNKLLARREFIPVPHLNVLAGAWIQFMVHDWFSHGKNDKNLALAVPLPEGDDWPEERMEVLGTTRSPRGPNDGGKPDAFVNVETHWWDASQIYGSNQKQLDAVRRGNGAAFPPDGKLWLDAKGLLPIDHTASIPNIELAGVNGNWWIGISVLHTLFAREHNAVVDRLKVDHPDKDGTWLLNKARLVVSALLAKIHTVEWTTALMNSPPGRMAMRGNYWGAMGEHFHKAFGRLTDGEVISGIPGSPANHHGAPYAITEEFNALYRLHSLLPDRFTFRRALDDAQFHEADIPGVSRGEPRRIYEMASFEDAVYSLATEHPGALTLHNFPNGLRNLVRDSDHLADMAAIDILRDRERGVPRFAEFRRQIGMKAPRTFAEITSNKTWQRELWEVYGSVDKVDLLVGCLAESQSDRGQPPGFGFSDTAFRIFILMASRRFKSDRFFTDDFRPAIYTETGYRWVQENSLVTVLRRHCPSLAASFEDARNPFFPWKRST